MREVFIKFIITTNGNTNFCKIHAYNENDVFIKEMPVTPGFMEYMARAKFPVNLDVAEVFIKPHLEEMDAEFNEKEKAQKQKEVKSTEPVFGNTEIIKNNKKCRR